MTPTLLSQFLSESRDLLEQASRGFLALEKAPDDPAVINELFRSVHTMKGASGLFDIAPFTAVVHAAEDLLDAVRNGRVALLAEMTDLFLEALDRIAQWLDDLEANGALGEGAGETGRTLSGRLRAFLGGDNQPPQPAPAVITQAGERAALPWLKELPAEVLAGLVAELAAGRGPLCALEYTPHEQAFYSGDDPLFTVLQLPGRRWFEAQPVTPWPALEDFDPFRCNLRFRAIVAADRAALAHQLRYVEDQATLVELAATDLAEAAGAGARHSAQALPAELLAPALDILDSQRQMLETPADPETWPGRIQSIGTVLRRLLDHLESAGAGLVPRLETALAEAGKTRSVAPLIEVIDAARALLEPCAGEGANGPAAGGELPRRRWDDPPAAEPGKEARKAAAIKVDQERIDALMNLAGELIVAKNSLPFLARRAEDVYGSRLMAREIKAQYDVINRIADDLQTAVMQVRMVPVAHVFQRFNRLVRDLARRLEKQIRLEIEGEETEADKTVVEELADPLVHLLRNAIDHGLEAPADRRLAGKPEEGVLRLKARQADDRVIIEISDDGRGIDVDKVKRKALERGLIDEALFASISDQDALQLIMEAGLSTADQVSDLSGRGVGMDVVRSMVRRTGGTITLDSEPGRGTRVTISLPLSMSVHRVMMIDVDRDIFGVPIESIVESVRVPAAGIHRHKTHETIVLRDRLIPLCRLRQVLDLGNGAGNGSASGHGRGGGEESVLVVNVGGAEVGLVVDNFRSGIDIIIKPLDGILAGLRQYSGAALLGDGSVLLVLNLRELIRCRWT
jgi:two-component system chemotaxis sensor kinase CheA